MSRFGVIFFSHGRYRTPLHLPRQILRRDRAGVHFDHAARVLTTAGVSLPIFFTGLLLVYVFYYLLGWAPAPLGRLDAFATPPAKITGSFLIDAVLGRISAANAIGSDFSGKCCPLGPMISNL